MYGVFKAEVGGAMIWLATVGTKEEAIEAADEEMLRVEECVIVVQLEAFRQQL